jgi:hypothetical protein
VYDVLNNAGFGGGANFDAAPKTYPAVSQNALYGRPVAHFSGDTIPSDNRRGSCAYRVDVVDYSQHAKYTAKEPIPFNALGTAMTTKSFSVEVIFKAEERKHDDGKIFGFTQGWGGAVGTLKSGDGFTVNFYMDMNENGGSASDTTEPFSLKFSETAGEAKELKWGEYYHVVAVYDRAQSKTSIYLDGVKSKDDHQYTAGYGMNLANTGTDALAQWIAIGGDARRSDPVVPQVHINSSFENCAEAIFKGDVVVARMYSKVLTDDEVKILYDYELPEAE